MDRTLNAYSGFTLVELIITVAVIGIILAVALGNFRGISQSNAVNRDVNSIASFLQDKRMVAFTRKVPIAIQTGVVAGMPFQQISTAPDFGPVNMDNTFISSSATFTINSRGMFSAPGSIRINGSNFGASRDCVLIANTRVRIGAWNSGTAQCNPE
jgi:prepilin-type N-terminal cleavage/methylation domain-containing protein